VLTGKCLCGGVRFEIDSALGPVIYRHCSMCRRASGSAFATNASVRADGFRIVAGRELISEYASSPSSRRRFCSLCGSPLFGSILSHPVIRRVRLGAIDSDPGARSAAHIWIGSKSPWFEITDHLEHLDEAPPPAYLAPGSMKSQTQE
jgi:hypothetical protein